MKVVIPVAGVGSRLKPHTHTTPKPLMEVAGKPIIDYIIDDILKINPSEVIFGVGYKKESIISHIKNTFPKLKCRFVEQLTMDGNGSAIRIALDGIEKDEELFVIFGDTLIDFSVKDSLKKAKGVDTLVYAMKVEDPQHYGVINVDEKNNIYEVEEKPKNPKSDLALIGAYYFKSVLDVKQKLDYLIMNKISINGEYNILQAIEKQIKEKKKVVTSPVKSWFDCGRPEVLLAANRYFLEKMSNGKIVTKENYIIIPPSYIAKTAKISRSIIGPYASIGEGVKIEDSNISDTIINPDATIKGQNLTSSLVGKQVYLSRKATKINIGEKSQLSLE